MSAVCLRSDKPGRIFVRNSRGREEKLVDSKALFVIPGFADPNTSYSTIDENLAKARDIREALAKDVNVQELWELLGLEEEAPDHAWSLDELSSLALGRDDAEALSAVYRSLDNDNIYFYRRVAGYIRRTQDQVEDIFQRQRAEELSRREHEAIKVWLLNLWNNPVSSGQTLVYPEEFAKEAQKLLRGLADVAVNGVDSPRYKELSELLKSLDIKRRDAPFQFMLKAGLWDENENLALYKYNISTEFIEEELQEAQACTALLDECGNAKITDRRLDLTGISCFTIDDASTKDIDDALSFEENEDGTYRAGIHIADASYYVKPDSLVDKIALERGTAIYLPDLRIPMCPDILSDSVCSLVAHKKRLAFSFLITFDKELNIIHSEMAPSVIMVQERLTYDSADEYLNSGRWLKLYEIVQALKARRRQAGAVNVPFPKVEVKVVDGKILIEPERTNSPAQLLVSELMILANATAGNYLAQHNIPGIFRSQEALEKSLTELEENFDPVKAYNSRRFLKRGSVGGVPARHSGLGLDNYVQVTSPIRRYNDLLMQRQLKSLVRDGVLKSDPPSESGLASLGVEGQDEGFKTAEAGGTAGKVAGSERVEQPADHESVAIEEAPEPFYSAEELDGFMARTKQATAAADAVEKDRRNYWILRYLEELTGEEMEAVVLANHPDKHIVQLCGCLLETDCPHVPGHPLPPGTKIHVRIDLVWPRDNTIRLSPLVE